MISEVRKAAEVLTGSSTDEIGDLLSLIILCDAEGSELGEEETYEAKENRRGVMVDAVDILLRAAIGKDEGIFSDGAEMYLALVGVVGGDTIRPPAGCEEHKVIQVCRMIGFWLLSRQKIVSFSKLVDSCKSCRIEEFTRALQADDVFKSMCEIQEHIQIGGHINALRCAQLVSLPDCYAWLREDLVQGFRGVIASALEVSTDRIETPKLCNLLDCADIKELSNFIQQKVSFRSSRPDKKINASEGEESDFAASQWYFSEDMKYVILGGASNVPATTPFTAPLGNSQSVDSMNFTGPLESHIIPADVPDHRRHRYVTLGDALERCKYVAAMD